MLWYSLVLVLLQDVSPLRSGLKFVMFTGVSYCVLLICSFFVFYPVTFFCSFGLAYENGVGILSLVALRLKSLNLLF